jgi:hypothetical protein
MFSYLRRVFLLNRERWYRRRRLRALTKLDVEYEIKGLSYHWPPIPPPSINFNQETASSIEQYQSIFFERSREKELPFLATVAHLNLDSTTLDFGCGLGRLASAFASSKGKYGAYYGWEPELEALQWLKRVYAHDPKFRFGGTQLPSEMNYVTNKGNYSSVDKNFGSKSEAAPDITQLKNLMDGKRFDLQFSSSVFTHMWSTDIISTLKSFEHIASDSSVFVNTWLIVDSFAQQSLDRGSADRRLPIEINGVLTYSHSNPLVCTVYRQEQMELIYKESGHQITDIHYGSWSGRSNGVTYQDIVVSKRITS